MSEERKKTDVVKEQIERKKLFVEEYSKYRRKKEIQNDSSDK